MNLSHKWQTILINGEQYKSRDKYLKVFRCKRVFSSTKVSLSSIVKRNELGANFVSSGKVINSFLFLVFPITECANAKIHTLLRNSKGLML